MLGHRFRFSSEADTMRWSCQRECGAGGAKRYPTPEDAARRYVDGMKRAVGTMRDTVNGLPIRGRYATEWLRAVPAETGPRRSRLRESTRRSKR